MGALTQVREIVAMNLRSIPQRLGASLMIVITEVPRKGDTSGANVTLRGVEPNGFTLRPEVKLVAGRRFRPGLRELMVGDGAYTQFAGLDIGQRLRFRGSDWEIVGRFRSGDAHDSELWTDLGT